MHRIGCDISLSCYGFRIQIIPEGFALFILLGLFLSWFHYLHCFSSLSCPQKCLWQGYPLGKNIQHRLGIFHWYKDTDIGTLIWQKSQIYRIANIQISGISSDMNYSNPRKYYSKDCVAERERQGRQLMACRGTSKLSDAGFRVLMHWIWCDISLDCYSTAFDK